MIASQANDLSGFSGSGSLTAGHVERAISIRWKGWSAISWKCSLDVGNRFPFVFTINADSDLGSPASGKKFYPQRLNKVSINRVGRKPYAVTVFIPKSHGNGAKRLDVPPCSDHKDCDRELWKQGQRRVYAWF